MRELLQKVEQARKEFMEDRTFCFTSDIDWASEYACDKAVRFFNDANIPVTMFLTHKSDILSNAIADKKIQAGLHPNFLAGSSQGESFDEVMDFLFELLPGAKCFRSHRYFDVNDILENFYKRGIRYDSNVCTLLDNMQPFLHRTKIIRFPIFLEDGAYLLNGPELDFKSVEKYFETPGLKVFNIHPMHLMLNTPYFSYTREIKDRLTKEEWNNLGEAEIRKLNYDGKGITNFIEEIIEYTYKKNIRTVYLEDAYNSIVK